VLALERAPVLERPTEVAHRRAAAERPHERPIHSVEVLADDDEQLLVVRPPPLELFDELVELGDVEAEQELGC
jgi:hypothetical protein